MLKKFFIGVLIFTSSFGIFATSEAAQYDKENYCCRDSYCGDYYNERNSNGDCYGGYCYGRGRGCR